MERQSLVIIPVVSFLDRFLLFSILFPQQQLLINQLGITVVLITVQLLFPTGFGHHNKTEITI